MPHPNKSAALRLGLLVFGALSVLTAIEFALALFLPNWFLLGLVALIKAGLVMYYYMHIYRLFERETETDRESFAYKLATNRIGLWLFFISDSFIFGGLLLSRISLLGATRPELNQALGLAVTSVLLISSFFANRAETAMAHGDRKQCVASLVVTIALGVLFLVGVVGVEWRVAPFGPADGVEGAVFYGMTGYHAFHVFTGVIILLIVLRNALRGHYSPEKHWAVEAAAVYWHFVDVVWVFYYPALYLFGSVK